MAIDEQVQRVLRLYADDCRPLAFEALTPADAFSGAAIWRLDTPRGPLCLRRWPKDHPTVERLEFIQAVLWHVDQEGFHQIPVPLETYHKHGYVRHNGHLWELTPWLPGVASFRQPPPPEILRNALVALAQFHQAALSFPLPEGGLVSSPGILERRDRLGALLAGGLDQIREAIRPDIWPELEDKPGQTLVVFAEIAPAIQRRLDASAELKVGLQPCIRDIHSAHVLYLDQQVSGIVDFGAMRADNVATDIARLLGSLALDDCQAWQAGLAAYQSQRQLSRAELRLIRTFDQSSVLMSPVQWLEWVFVERREFPTRHAMTQRYNALFGRLARLSQALENDRVE